MEKNSWLSNYWYLTNCYYLLICYSLFVRFDNLRILELSQKKKINILKDETSDEGTLPNLQGSNTVN